MSQELVVVLDFGSQYNQLIARRVREQRVYCEILPCHTPYPEILARHPKGIIFSGGPASVYQAGAPHVDPKLFEAGIPVLGICYGMQLVSHLLGGAVARTDKREYGPSILEIDNGSLLFEGLPKRSRCWMSHGDKVDRMPAGFKGLAHTDHSPLAAIGDIHRKIFGVQFHPEVVHTEFGAQILQNFIFKLCGCHPVWTIASVREQALAQIRQEVGEGRVVLGLSGGVDSSVASVLIHQAIGDRLQPIFVDNGLLRDGEKEQVVQTFQNHFHMQLRVVDAADRFLAALKDVSDPEQKRKIIGREFVEVFEQSARQINATHLAQGTLYPDVIESQSAFGGPSAVIKTHHNVGGLPERMHLKLLEPLRHLFKDDVRELGRELGLPADILGRHPFPGPGLAVRILGPVTSQRLAVLREADRIFMEEIRRAGIYDQIWQAFCVLLPVHSVGVMGDERTYEQVIAVRAVTSTDGMTADWARIAPDVLAQISNRIINEVAGVNRVVYDVSSKPPATIEWE